MHDLHDASELLQIHQVINPLNYLKRSTSFKDYVPYLANGHCSTTSYIILMHVQEHNPTIYTIR